MSVLPVLATREVLRRLARAGFKIVSQKGSHIKLFNPRTGRRTGLPLHPGDLKPGLLREILKQAGLTIDRFLRL